MIEIYLISLVVMLAVGVAICVLLISSLRNDVPIVLVPQDTLEAALDALDLESNLVFYDLGSGFGQVVRSAGVRGARSIGVENNLILVLLARLFGRGSYRRADLQQTDLSEADRVFMFLGQHLVDELLPKLVTELKPGSIVVSVDYPFTDRTADRTIKLNHARRIGRTIYVYNF